MALTVLEREQLKAAKLELVGKAFKHFKGNIYFVDSVAMNADTNEVMIIYHDIQDIESIWARPYSEFTGPVDKQKYPNAKQERRFEEL